MKLKSLIFLFLISIIFVSCKSRQPETRTSAKQIAVDSIYQLMENNHFQAEWFSGKFKGVYQLPEKKQAFSGQIRIKKDSIVWISIYAMVGIEVFRLEVKPDSFRFVNRIDKKFMHESTEMLKQRFNIDLDFEMLQSIILGNDFPYYETGVFQLNQFPQSYQLSTVSRRKLKRQNNEKDSKILVQNIWIDKNNYRIIRQNAKIVGQEKTKLRVRYDEFGEIIDGGLFPHKLILHYKEDNKSFIELNFSKIAINNTLSFPFKIPKKYERSSFNDR